MVIYSPVPEWRVSGDDFWTIFKFSEKDTLHHLTDPVTEQALAIDKVDRLLLLLQDNSLSPKYLREIITHYLNMTLHSITRLSRNKEALKKKKPVNSLESTGLENGEPSRGNYQIHRLKSHVARALERSPSPHDLILIKNYSPAYSHFLTRYR